MGPRFEPGAKVRTRTQNALGHTRLPGYLQSKPATVLRHIGSFPLPDEAAVDPKNARFSELYAVEFEAREVWGRAASSGRICADIFEEYLESAE